MNFICSLGIRILSTGIRDIINLNVLLVACRLLKADTIRLFQSNYNMSDKGQYVKKRDGNGGVNPEWAKIHGKPSEDKRPKEQKAESRRLSDNASSGYYEGYSAVDNE